MTNAPKEVSYAGANATRDFRINWEKDLQGYFNPWGTGRTGFSNAYNSWLFKRMRRCIEAIFRGCSLEGKRVLQVGCGNGYFVRCFLGKGAEVCGIDVSGIGIQAVENKFAGKFSVMDITNMEFAMPEKFDIVNLWDGACRLDGLKFEDCLSNAASVCKPGGILLICCRAGAERDTGGGEPVKFRSVETHDRILTRYGFSLGKMVPLYNFLNRRIMPHLDEFLAPLYFLADNLAIKFTNANVSVCVWQRAAELAQDGIPVGNQFSAALFPIRSEVSHQRELS